MLLSEDSIRKLIKSIILSETTDRLSGNYQSVKKDSGFFDEDEDDFTDGEISFDTSNVSAPQSVINRCIKLGKETGIDPAFIYATEAKESGHNPGVMAWNLHISTNNKYSKSAGAPDISQENIQKMKSATLKFPHKKTKSGGTSFYGKNAKKAFDAAYKIDPWHAIAGGAWGFYQVLGAYTLPLYNNDPKAWMSAFKSKPSDHSIKAFKKWVTLPEKRGFKEAANRGDYATTTELYYGSNADDYRNFIAKKAAEWKAGLPQKKAESSKNKGSGASSSWKNRLGTETRRGINFHKLEDGKNNYRAGIKNKHTNPTVEFWKELKKEYGIKNVSSLNADSGGKAAANNAEKAGLNVFKNFIGENNMGSRSAFNKAKSMLKQGNTLIHCTHGADRTGAYVGRYYMEELGWDLNKALKDTKKYGGHKSGSGYKSARDFLEKGP